MLAEITEPDVVLADMNTTAEDFRIDNPYPQLTRELLYEEYITNRLTDQQIAHKYNVGSKTSIWRRRKFFGIQNANPNKSNKNASKNRTIVIDKEDALRWMETGKDYFEIARELGCSRISVCRRFKELGLVRETREAKKKLRWHTELSDIQTRLLLGTILGDGNITMSGMFQCNHSAKQKDYIKYKLSILNNLVAPDFKLVPTEIKLKGYSKIHHGLYLRTMQNEYLKSIAKAFYSNGEKTFPLKYLSSSRFDNFSLAIWFMDDGSRQGNSANISTLGFGGYKEHLEIASFLWDKFGLKAEIRFRDRFTSEQCYLAFLVADAKNLFTLVAPYIVPSMQYKLPPAFRTTAKQKGASVISAV